MRETDAWLPDLAPPPGGLARLRDGVRAQGRHRRVAWFAGAAVAIVAVMLALALFPGWLQRYRVRGEWAEVVRQAVQSPSPGRLRMIDGAAVALESGQAGVRLYLVQPVRGSRASSQR